MDLISMQSMEGRDLWSCNCIPKGTIDKAKSEPVWGSLTHGSREFSQIHLCASPCQCVRSACNYPSRSPTSDQCKFRSLGSLASLRVAPLLYLNFCLLIIKIMRYITRYAPLALTEARIDKSISPPLATRRTHRRGQEKYIHEFRLCAFCVCVNDAIAQCDYRSVLENSCFFSELSRLFRLFFYLLQLSLRTQWVF